MKQFQRLGKAPRRNHTKPPSPQSSSPLTARAPLLADSRKEMQRCRADRRPDEIPDANGRFVNAAVFALRITRIHRIEER